MISASRSRYLQEKWLSAHRWRRRGVFWAGAVLVSLVAILFAKLATQADGLLHRVCFGRPWLALVIPPAGFALAAWITRRFFPTAQGSGIPQVIAASDMQDPAEIRTLLSLRVALAKIALTLLGLASGASIGREGPTVQISASIMRALGQAIRMPQAQLRALVLAGGAAGVAAAFNTPLAGVVFAIEELSHSFDHHTTGKVMTAVIIAGIASTVLIGDHSYFGQTAATLPVGIGWAAVLVCATLGGLSGGLFARLLLLASAGFPGWPGKFIAGRPILFAALCGLVVGALGLVSAGATFGTGYREASSMVAGHYDLPMPFFAAKLLATLASYASGIPGGIFAPSLAIGAGLGRSVAHFMPAAPAGAVVLLGMVAYFSGVVQAPITATVIVMEMTANQSMTIPLMATSFLAYGASRLVCRHALYGALAHKYLLKMEGSPAAVSLMPLEEPETEAAEA